MTNGTLIAEKYRLERQIGHGATGVVWAAVNVDTSREVALKLILQSTDDLRYRLLREAHACGQLRHRNIVDVYDVGKTEQGDPFLVMQLLDGETLAQKIRREPSLSPPEAAKIARDVARALAVAHGARIIHRDLKPANIFLQKEDGADDVVVKVLDFGVSKNLARAKSDIIMTAPGSAVGSPAYMSPEQARADGTLDHRSDIWSLGVVLFEMLAGVRPFRGGVAQVVCLLAAGEIPSLARVAPHVDPGLAALVAGCLERDREKRIASAAELATELERYATPGSTRVSVVAVESAEIDDSDAPTVKVDPRAIRRLIFPPNDKAMARTQPLPKGAVAELVDTFDSNVTVRFGRRSADPRGDRAGSLPVVNLLFPGGQSPHASLFAEHGTIRMSSNMVRSRLPLMRHSPDPSPRPPEQVPSATSRPAVASKNDPLPERSRNVLVAAVGTIWALALALGLLFLLQVKREPRTPVAPEPMLESSTETPSKDPRRAPPEVPAPSAAAPPPPETSASSSSKVRSAPVPRKALPAVTPRKVRAPAPLKDPFEDSRQ